MTEVRIITHPNMIGSSSEDDFLTSAMRVIGVGFGEPDEWCAKYGTNIETSVFLMHRFCWCESPHCPWCAGCFCDDNAWRDGEKAPPGQKCAWCKGEHCWAEKGALPPDQPPHRSAPNFWYKPSGFRLWWYKYIGRDMEIHGELPSDFLIRIFATHPRGMTLEQAIKETARQEEETAASFARMLRLLE